MIRRPSIPAAIALFAALLVAGCDRDTSPPIWKAEVVGMAPVGSAFLALAGDGIASIEGVGETLAFMHESEEEGIYRVVLIGGPGGEPLRFEIHVRDRRTDPPQATLIELFGTNNVRQTQVAQYRVEIRP